MSHESRYYIAKGRSLQAVESWREKYRRTMEAGRALAEEIGAEHAAYTHSICGFSFKDDIAPEGWEKAGHVKDRPFFRPTRRTKAGRALRDRMTRINVPGLWEFERLLGGGEAVIGGNRLALPTFETLGNDVILVIPVAKREEQFTPPDAEPIKASEYWARKEAKEASADAAE